MVISNGATEMTISKYRIMVVDDKIEQLKMVEYASRVTETLIIIKKGGPSALEMLHEIDYEVDAVIADLSMPVMDGITFTEQVRRQEKIRAKRVPIEFFWFTGFPFDAKNEFDPIMMAKKDNNVHKIFLKPHDAVDLIEQVKTILEDREVL